MKTLIPILIIAICLTGCATSASRWKEPVMVSFTDEAGIEHETDKVLYYIEHMQVGYGGKVDFEKGTLNAKPDPPFKGIVSTVIGQKVTNE